MWFFALKAIEFIKEAEAAGIDINKVCDSLGMVNELDTTLKFQSNKEFEMATMSNVVEHIEE